MDGLYAGSFSSSVELLMRTHYGISCYIVICTKILMENNFSCHAFQHPRRWCGEGRGGGVFYKKYVRCLFFFKIFYRKRNNDLQLPFHRSIVLANDFCAPIISKVINMHQIGLAKTINFIFLFYSHCQVYWPGWERKKTIPQKLRRYYL